MTLIDHPVRGSASGRPIMALLDLLGRRWTLRVVWELRDGAMSFRALQAACSGMSPSVLNQRLAELREALIVEAGEGGYALSARGRELLALFGPLQRWSEEWALALRDG
ncbi:helix-turn-helix domain-containing protein [Solimonas sp. SE-A11]|uniref:winged helix-turn-helix transcriptional regulator n=1 Tax=Solimonas sp. SE-A11 TaxID=3054954 RepID=UPI00259CF112|nr:helix-turn-helix domain-containing protein [Solimonas sp. SE-A11]MDM4772050.1 helix-turn-helix domain-containing protein [Solimonas sp. SE-A11]